MKSKKYIIVLLLVSLTLVSGSSFDLESGAQEYVLKAAFLYRFINYIDWGNTSMRENFIIAVLGKSAIISPLMNITKGKKAKGKRIMIKEYYDANSNDIIACQVLFVSNNCKLDIENIVAKLGDKPILIVAERPDACAKGATINFLISENKLKFEININAATEAGLKISSQLLQLAILVNTL